MLVDTQQAADRLKEGGFNEEHARAIMDVWRMSDAQAATKQDVAELRTEIRQAQLEMTRSVRNWVAGSTGIVALLMTPFEFIAI